MKTSKRVPAEAASLDSERHRPEPLDELDSCFTEADYLAMKAADLRHRPDPEALARFLAGPVRLPFPIPPRRFEITEDTPEFEL